MGRCTSVGLRRAVPFLGLWFLAAVVLLPAQGTGSDFNLRYRFPLSLGVEYQSLSPFAAYGSVYNVFDLSANLRWPLPALPVLQPTLKAGLIRFDSQSLDEPLRWDHTHWYAALGLVLAHRFAKNFEVGVDAFGGFSEAVFPNLLPDQGPRGNPNLFLEAGGRIALDPSYNLSVDIRPSLKVLHSLGVLEDFDGLILGIGFSASFRLGQDPDLATGPIRSLRFSEASLPPVFAAMQSFYAKTPAGRIRIANTDKHPVTDVKVSFFQPGYMDSPTPCASLPELAGGEGREVDLFALFNQEVFRTEGVTPLTGEVIVTYRSRGRAAEQRQSVSYDLYDRTALTWDDTRKVAAFITPSDGALRNYASFIRRAVKDQEIPTYNEPLQAAMQVFAALAEMGILYQADPVLPFTRAQNDPLVVDSISLPRDTLTRITGDCDDLTVLYDSLLESVGIETGFITTPGHIYSALNTRVPGREFGRLHPDREMTINLDGELWVPVEITMIGKTGFLDAWRKGVEEWREHESHSENRQLLRTRAAQSVYRPVGLKETDLGLQYGRAEEIARGFSREMDRLVEAAVAGYVQAANHSGRKEDYNRIGVTYARFLRYPQARAAFDQALKIDPGYLSSRVNLANLYFLQKDYVQALARYEEAWKKLKAEGQDHSPLGLKVLINISSANYQLQRSAEAERYYRMAQTVDPAGAAEYAYMVAPPASGEGRAAERRDAGYAVQFVGEEAE